jgi:hypothetical protein
MHVQRGEIRFVQLVAVTIMLTVSIAYSGPAQQHDPTLVKKQYDEVASRLDTGGDLYAVANVDGLLEQFVSNLISLVSLTPTNNTGTTATQAAITKLPAFLQQNGFYAAHCWGMSSVPRTDGLNTVKVFISRDPAAASLPLWRGLTGEPKQRKLAGTDFLPSDTVIARVFNGNLPDLWQIVRSGVKEIAQPKTALAFEQSLSGVSTNLGIDIDKLIGSASDEGFVSVQLARNTTVDIPTASGPISIPTPSILIGVAVKDDSIQKLLDIQLANKAIPVVTQQLGNVAVKSVNFPLPLPIPLEPTYAMCNGFFLLGSNTKVVSDAIAASKNKNGLIADSEFNNAFKGLSMTNNGIAYVSPRFMKAIQDIQSKTIAAATPEKDAVGAMLLRSLTSRMSEYSSAFVILNLENGILFTGTSTSGGKEIVAAATLAPVGLMAAIAIPSFVKAKDTSKKNACINNLRMIDAAKEQWALEKSKKDGDKVNAEDIKKYLKGNKMPVCPQRGTYEINPIGSAPECSISEHKLNW